MATILAQVSHCVFRPLSATQAVEQQTKAELSGKWQKDKSQSDSMQQACDVVELKWVLRRALAILNTLEVLTCAARFCKKAILNPLHIYSKCSRLEILT